MRGIRFIALGILLLSLLADVVRAETLQLTNGTSVTGEIILPGAVEGLNVRVSAGQYQRVPWTSFSEATLKDLAKNPKLVTFIEPLLTSPENERTKMTEVEIKPVARLQRPAKGSFLGAMFSTGIGLAILGFLYAANIYAAHEIAVIQDRPRPLVCGVCAVLPVIGQIIFLCMPLPAEAPRETQEEAQARTQAHAQNKTAPQTHAPQAQGQPDGLRLSQSSEVFSGEVMPETQFFERGKFMFNRRFFETKFSGFFGVVRRDTEKDMVLLIKAARGHYEAHRITRITANEMYLDVHKGGASQEVSIPFTEIQEVQLKHRNAPD